MTVRVVVGGEKESVVVARVVATSEFEVVEVSEDGTVDVVDAGVVCVIDAGVERVAVEVEHVGELSALGALFPSNMRTVSTPCIGLSSPRPLSCTTIVSRQRSAARGVEEKQPVPAAKENSRGVGKRRIT